MNQAGFYDSRYGNGKSYVRIDESRWATAEQVMKPPLARLDVMSGWRLWITIACLLFGLLLAALETSIVATALVTISSDLGGYDRSNWVVTAYLITYTGFLIVFARLSDLFGRKWTLVASLSIFIFSSLACGLSKSMEHLIVFRSFQGIGGAGLYSLAMSVMTEITPLKFAGVVAGVAGSIFALASVLGPVLGGIITYHSTWKWVFFLNIPPGLVVLLAALFFFPPNSGPLKITPRTVLRIDFLGVATSLTSCILIIFALESGGIFYAWNSSTIVVAFLVAGICFIGFVSWQWAITKQFFNTTILPLFPIYLMVHRIICFTMLTAFITGFPFLMTIIFLPQRLQLQHQLSSVQAGIQMLALLLLSATGAAAGGMLCMKYNISWYLLVGSQIVQIIGLGLMSTLPATGELPPVQVGYQVILGLGFGLTLSCLAFTVQIEVEEKDSGIVLSAITQVRVLGGVIGVAIGQTIISSRLRWELGPVIGPIKLAALLRSTEVIKTFPQDEIILAVECYGRAFILQNKIMVVFSVFSLLACLGSWKRHLESGTEVEKRRQEERGGMMRRLRGSRIGQSVSRLRSRRLIRTFSKAPQINMKFVDDDDSFLLEVLGDLNP